METTRLVLEADGAGDYRAPAGFVDVHEACAMLGFSRRTLNKWQALGRITCARWARYPEADKPGARRVYSLEEIRRLVAAHRSPETFPPPGWVTKEDAAALLGVSVETLANANWVKRLSPGSRYVARPDGGRCKLYPLANAQRVVNDRAAAAEAAAQAAADEAALRAVPEGFVDRAGALRILRITPRAFKHWITDGKITFGRTIPAKNGGRASVYPVEALKKLREEMLGRDNLFKGAAGTFEVPDGWARPREARQMFGVDRPTWDGWARDGLLPPGERFDGGPTVYRIKDLKKTLVDARVIAPPYPDPGVSGAWRVPLCGSGGRDAGGREAVLDAETLALLEGAVLSWESVNGEHSQFVGLCRPEKPRGFALRRLIMGVTDDGLQVGHMNGDPLDCRRANLVVRTIKQRTRRSRKMRSVNGQPCTSRFKGVCLERWTGRWRARIVADGTTHRLGRFRDEIAAAEAYDEAARELFGEHARLNFPDGVDARLEAEQARMRIDAAQTPTAEAA